MDKAQFLKNLSVPTGKIDVVLDTDAYNEIDDQFAIAYMLRCREKLNVKGFCAAPFSGNNRCEDDPAYGMEKSYEELKKIITLEGSTEFLDKIYRGSERYLPDEKTPVESEAARFMADLANGYSPERPLYIVAIGAITNVASAILMNPAMKENTVIVWLGGNALHWMDNNEFNLRQDVAAARIIFGCGVPFVQLPCCGVVDKFTVSKPELEYWLKGKNALSEYLAQNTIDEAESYAAGKPWTRVIWDVTAVAWLMNDGGRFMADTLMHSPIPEYDNRYAEDLRRHFYTYVYKINRDTLFGELFSRLTK